MPFNLWITRSSASDARTSAPPAPGAELDRAEVGDLLAIYDAVEHPPDHAHWLFYPDSGEPWCSLFQRPATGALGHVVLSASFANAKFMRNVLDMHDLALKLAERLDGRVFQEENAEPLTRDNIDERLDPDGEFVTGLHKFWRAGQNAIWTGTLERMEAPFEVPVGPIDQVTDYFLFKIRMAGKAPTITELAANIPAHLTLHVMSHTLILEDTETETPVVRILRLEDGLIVRPYYTHLPFAQLARETLAAVDRAEKSFAGRVEYDGKPCDAKARAELATHAKGLGVEFYEWREKEGRR